MVPTARTELRETSDYALLELLTTSSMNYPAIFGALADTWDSVRSVQGILKFFFGNYKSSFV